MTIPSNPLAYEGIPQRRPPERWVRDRDPTTHDYQLYLIGDLWWNKITFVWWIMTNKVGTVATWEDFAGSGSKVQSVTTEDAVVVVPDANNNINLLGDAATGSSTTGSGSTATVHNVLASDAEAIAGTVTNELITPGSLKAKLGTQTSHGAAYGATTSGAVGWTAGLADGQFMIGSSIGVPTASTLTSADGSVIFTAGHNSLDLSTTGTGHNEVESITTDDAVVVLPNAAGNVNWAGNAAQGVHTTGDIPTFKVTANVNHADASQTITGSATNVLVDPAGLTAKLGVQTAKGIAYGAGNTSALAWTGALNDGMLAIGSTAGVVAAANITAPDGSITVTNGANSIVLSAAGTGKVATLTGWTTPGTPVTPDTAGDILFSSVGSIAIRMLSTHTLAFEVAAHLADHATVLTTDATPTLLYSLTMSTLQMVSISVIVGGTKSDFSASLGAKLFAAFRCPAGTAIQVGTTTSDIKTDSGGAPTVAYTVSTDKINVFVTGVALESWSWNLNVQYLSL